MTAAKDQFEFERWCAFGLVIQERFRQMTQEGFDVDHDDRHTEGQMAKAAARFADPNPSDIRTSLVDTRFPWDPKWDSRPRDQDGDLIPVSQQDPRDRIRNLVKAGALLVAEIERLMRANPSYLEGGNVPQLEDLGEALSDTMGWAGRRVGYYGKVLTPTERRTITFEVDELAALHEDVVKGHEHELAEIASYNPAVAAAMRKVLVAQYQETPEIYPHGLCPAHGIPYVHERWCLSCEAESETPKEG